MKKIAVIHYDEIALKGGNRRLFEQVLVNNLATKIQEHGLPLRVHNQWGRIVVEQKTKEDVKWDEECDKVLLDICAKTPGVAVFGIGLCVDSTEESIMEGVADVAQYILKGRRVFNTFSIMATRTDKAFPSSSQEIAKRAGDVASDIFGDTKKVQLTHPELTIKVEILQTESYIYERLNGLSGLPVGSSGRAVALLSGGFDSPVATHMCAVRGVRPILMHFHSYPHTSRAAIEKVEAIAGVLRDVCGSITLVFVPLLPSQKEIAMTAPERLRVVLYRRLMVRAAEVWAQKHNARAIITGESVGQVASQTLENISAVAQATSLPILRPLSGMNKQEIINRAREIGTHDISVLPHDDTCTVFMPKHPETRAKLEDVLEAEKNYDSENLITEMLKKSEIIKL